MDPIKGARKGSLMIGRGLAAQAWIDSSSVRNFGFQLFVRLGFAPLNPKPGFGFRVGAKLGFRIQGLCFGAEPKRGPEFRLQGSSSSFWGLGFRV